MEKYAIVQLDGKQYKVTEGLKLKLNRQKGLNFDVLLYSDGKTLEIGDPLLKDVILKAKIVSDMLAPKIVVGRYKSKSRYQKTRGHRQPISIVLIESIEVVKKSAKPKAAKVTKKKGGKK